MSEHFELFVQQRKRQGGLDLVGPPRVAGLHLLEPHVDEATPDLRDGGGWCTQQVELEVCAGCTSEFLMRKLKLEKSLRPGPSCGTMMW